MQTSRYASNHTTVVPVVVMRMFVDTMVSGNIDSLNFFRSDQACNHAFGKRNLSPGVFSPPNRFVCDIKRKQLYLCLSRILVVFGVSVLDF